MERNFASALAFVRSRSRPRSTSPPFMDPSLPTPVLPAGGLAGKGAAPVDGMKGWLYQLGYTDNALAKLRVIHVAGTKGKGSTCAFIESFLRVHGRRTNFPRKTGLYTSPHLISVTERIRIDFQPLPEAVFAKYVFEVQDALGLDHHNDGAGGRNDGPGYLQFLALVSLHAFIQEGVDVAIYETHHGGEYCATNVIKEPIVTAITNIGLDHIIDLGPSVENIAWHKAGILKAGAAAFTLPQQTNVSAVLKDRAANKGVNLRVVEADLSLPSVFDDPIQRLNCSLARAVTDAFLQQAAPSLDQSSSLSRQDVIDGIQQFHWPGRFEIIQKLSYTWLLDGAHNEMSIAYAARWFQRVSLERGSSSTTRIVIFSQKATNRRDYEGMVRRLARSLEVSLHCIIFTTYHADEVDVTPNEEITLPRYSKIWQNARPGEQSFMAKTTAEAINLAKGIDTETGDVHILVTGSLHLVGRVLQLGL